MKRIILQAVLYVLLLILPGCGRLVDWGRDSFYQGCDTDYNLHHARDYIRSVTVLNELQTVGMFDALWLNDEVIKLYVNAYAQRNCLSEKAHDDMRSVNLAKNDTCYSFYITTLNKFPLGDPYHDCLLYTSPSPRD